MASFFDEIGALDLPFAPVKVTIGGKTVDMQARRPSAEEQDAMEVFFADEHAKVLAQLKESVGGKPCELDTLRSIFSGRPDADLISQLMGTRRSDVNKRAIQLSGMDLLSEYVRIKKLPEAEQQAAEAENDAKIQEFIPQATAEIEAEYDGIPHAQLVDQAAENAVNIKALAKANQRLGADYVYYTLYRPDATKRAFESTAQVRQKLTPETIDAVARAIREALEKDSDLPPASPEGSAPSGRSSLPSTSAEGTTTSGEPIAMTPADSNSSSTPA